MTLSNVIFNLSVQNQQSLYLQIAFARMYKWCLLISTRKNPLKSLTLDVCGSVVIFEKNNYALYSVLYFFLMCNVFTQCSKNVKYCIDDYSILLFQRI